MPGQNPTPDQAQPPVVWILDEAAELLVTQPEAGKASAVAAMAAHMVATGSQAGIVVTHPKVRPALPQAEPDWREAID